ncbi:MAG: tautomerase family protein, partial [Alphaproteobacteria bacterium]|nr:tautomerase family protein [Alphaproteobacteria bacterium]
MPYIEAKMSNKLDDNQKDNLQKKLTGAVSNAFGKPKAYIMANIEDDKALYMA